MTDTTHAPSAREEIDLFLTPWGAATNRRSISPEAQEVLVKNSSNWEKLLLCKGLSEETLLRIVKGVKYHSALARRSETYPSVDLYLLEHGSKNNHVDIAGRSTASAKVQVLLAETGDARILRVLCDRKYLDSAAQRVIAEQGDWESLCDLADRNAYGELDLFAYRALTLRNDVEVWHHLIPHLVHLANVGSFGYLYAQWAAPEVLEDFLRQEKASLEEMDALSEKWQGDTYSLVEAWRLTKR